MDDNEQSVYGRPAAAFRLGEEPADGWPPLHDEDGNELERLRPGELPETRAHALLEGLVRVCLVGHEGLFWKAAGFDEVRQATLALVAELASAADVSLDVVAVGHGECGAGRWRGLRAVRMTLDDAVERTEAWLGAYDVAISATEEREMVSFCRRVLRSRHVGILVHSVHGVPYGPESSVELLARHPHKLAMLSGGTGSLWPQGWKPPPATLLCASEALCAYTRVWLGLRCTPQLCYAADFGYFEKDIGNPPISSAALKQNHRTHVTMISPCAAKGSAVFVALARGFPRERFLAVSTSWTDPVVLEELRKVPNVEVLPAKDDLNEIYAKTRVLLVPSLWSESFALVAMEAQLRGIPVLSTDKGGLPESNVGPEELTIKVEDQLHLDRARCIWKMEGNTGVYTLSVRQEAQILDMHERVPAETDDGNSLELERARREAPLPTKAQRAKNLVEATLLQLDCGQTGSLANRFIAPLKRLLADNAYYLEVSARVQTSAEAFVKQRRGKLLDWIRLKGEDELGEAPPDLSFSDLGKFFATKAQYQEAAAVMAAAAQNNERAASR